MEHRVAALMEKQARHGVLFHKVKARFLIHSLTEQIDAIDRKYLHRMPLTPKDLGPVNKPFLKSGKYSKMTEDWREGNPVEVSGPFTRLEWEEWDFGKTARFKDWLLDHGWVPDTWNYKDITISTATGKKAPSAEVRSAIVNYLTKLRVSKDREIRVAMLGIPKGSSMQTAYNIVLKRRVVPTTSKITESSLKGLSTDIGLAIMHRMILSHRRSLLEGLCKLVRSDGRISARANPCATPTARMRHSGVVNIPAPRSVYGKQLRACFIAQPGYRFIGYDASALELRMFAHYLNNPEFTKELLEGDIHTRNQQAAGLGTRDEAKTFIYAFLYGAGNGKLGEIVGGGATAGARIREQFLASNPGLQELIESTQCQASKGYLVGLDGRKLWMRKDESGDVATHKALNTLLQAAGAIVMKWAAVWLEGKIAEMGLRAYPLIFMHDEQQYECHEEDVDALVDLMENCVTMAGQGLGMTCPLASEAKVGFNWFDTH